MSKQLLHYDIDPIDKEGALFNIIFGKRSNGKSYQVKHKKAVEKYINGGKSYYTSYEDKTKIIEELIEKGSRFMLIRRLQEEIKPSLIEQYFNDVDVKKITNNKYNCIKMRTGQLYLANFKFNDNKNKAEYLLGEKIGYVVALSTEQNYAGGSYLDVHDIIMEEFMARQPYLYNEPDKLINLWSTVDRDRGTTRLWLVGNTISRICPYLTEWGLQPIISNMKKGDIKTVWLPTGKKDKKGNEIEVKLAIEYCIDNGGASLAIGKHKKMLNEGDWQSDPQPHLPKSKNCYTILYRIAFQYQSYKFIGEYLRDDEENNTVWFIYPYNKELKKDIIVISDVVKPSLYWQRNIYDISIKNDKLRRLLSDTFRENRIFYANDLVGTDFKQVIDFEIRR